MAEHITMPPSQRSELVTLMEKVTMHNAPLPLLPENPTLEFPSITRQLDIALTAYNNRKKLLLPELRDEETIALFSDYSGEHHDSDYLTYTFLACSWGTLFWFADKMSELRKQYFHDKPDKEISYKDIGWGGIKRSLKEYLRLADFLLGLLLTIVVDKRIKSFFGEDPNAIISMLSNHGLGTWKSDASEKLLRICHIATYITTLLSKENQKFFWMSDHDAITKNPSDLSAVKILTSLLPEYGRDKLDLIGFALPFEERSLMTLDALSLTDITAGVLQHYFTQHKTKGQDFLVKEQTASIIQWLGHQSLLKKHCVIFRYIDNSHFQAANIAFEAPEIPSGTTIIPIAR